MTITPEQRNHARVAGVMSLASHLLQAGGIPRRYWPAAGNGGGEGLNSGGPLPIACFGPMRSVRFVEGRRGFQTNRAVLREDSKDGSGVQDLAFRFE
jgi:hypothetical protein